MAFDISTAKPFQSSGLAQVDDSPESGNSLSIFQRNKSYSKAPSDGYQTQLNPKDETNFQKWVKTNNIPFDPSTTADYDMRGFYKELQSGGQHAQTGISKNDGKLHFTDYFKTPYHKSFSAESKYAADGAPKWNGNDQLVLPSGKVVFDERNPGTNTNTFDLATARPVDQPSQGLTSADPSLYDTSDDRSRSALRVGKEAARQIGRGGLALAEGAVSLPILAGNVLNRVADFGLEKAGANFRFGQASIRDTVDPQGQLAPQNAAERYSDRITQGLGGVGTGIGIGGALQGAASPVTAGIGTALATRPAFQAASAASGASSSELAKDAGAGPVGQTLAGLVGSFGPYGALEGSKAIARGARALVEPFTEAGRSQIIGRTLNQSASNPSNAQTNMAAAAPIVPGSNPTAAEVSKDYGIIRAQRAARTRDPQAFAERSSEQNTARQESLDKASKDQTALTNIIARRDGITKVVRDRAFSQASGKTVDTDSIGAKIDQMLADPNNAGSRTQQALNYAKEQIAGKTDPRALYAVRKELSDVIAGKVESEKSFLRYTGGELKNVRDLIDDGIQAIAPSWKEYLTKYRQLSRPIDRIKAIQEAQGKASLAPSDALTGREVLSQAKFKQQAKALTESGLLTKGQRTRVAQISTDLDRGMSINDPNIRAIGSNTTQDMTAANAVGQALGSTKLTPFVRTLTRPIQWLYRIPEEQLQELLTESLLDPQIGAALMRSATGANLQRVGQLLRQRFVASGIGTGQSLATPQKERQESSPE